MRKHLAQWPLFPVQPELISIHLPKTAGSSFHAALQEVYGWHLKHLFRPDDWINFEKPKVFKCAKPCVKVVHGHLHHIQPAWKQLYPKARWITWLRDPVDRVVSAYFHWQKPVNHQDAHHKIFANEKPDLLTFAAAPQYKPVTHVYNQILSACEPADFFFVGRTEHYAQDLQSLATLLHWTSVPHHIKNTTVNKPSIDKTTRAQLKQHLAEEYAVYNRFLSAKFPNSP